MAKPTQPQPGQKEKPLTRSEKRKKYIESYYRHDGFINAFKEQLRLIVDEEKEMYQFLDRMENVLLNSGMSREEVLDGDIAFNEENKVVINGAVFELNGERTGDFEEKLWMITQPGFVTSGNSAQLKQLLDELITLITGLCSLGEDAKPDFHKIALANVASLALFMTSFCWDKPMIKRMQQLSKDAPFALVRSMIKMGIAVTSTGITNAELGFARNELQKRRFQKRGRRGTLKGK